MNEYLKAFQDMTQSAEQLLADEHNSLEIKQSATKLNQSVQPCFQELKQSASRIKQLVLVCADDLYHAEDVWNSKAKIAEASQQEIWEQLGEISGCSIKIINLANRCKQEAIEQSNKVWDIKFEVLRKKCFVDSKGKAIKGIGFTDKDVFFKELDTQLESQYQSISRSLNTSLSLIYKEITSIQLELIQHCISLLDNQDKAHYSQKFLLVVNEIETKFTNPTEHLPNYLIKFNTSVKADVKALKDKPGWETYWEDVVKFNEIVYSKIDKFITEIFDDRVKLATKALEQAIAFYNYFLEKQNRYQQETPAQRQAEKAWIDQQRQQLVQVKNSIEAILSDS